MLTIGKAGASGLCEVRWNGRLTQWSLEKLSNGVYRMIRPDGVAEGLDSIAGCRTFLSRRFARTIGRSERQSLRIF